MKRYRIPVILILSILVLNLIFGINFMKEEKRNNQLATFGAGCFWCTEAIFSNLKGVESVVSGYSGGDVVNPEYKQVCSGNTGHAEVVQIKFNPDIISYTDLLQVFWEIHDPTTLNRQGNDIGTQYRSVILYHNEIQKKLAEQYKKQLNNKSIWNKPIVTEILPFIKFYKAENYHQDYYLNNSDKPYCSLIIAPKIEKFKKQFNDKLKE